MAKKKHINPKIIVVPHPVLTTNKALELRELQVRELALRSELVETQRKAQQIQEIYTEVKQDLHDAFKKHSIYGFTLQANTLKYIKEEVEVAKTG